MNKQNVIVATTTTAAAGLFSTLLASTTKSILLFSDVPCEFLVLSQTRNPLVPFSCTLFLSLFLSFSFYSAPLFNMSPEVLGNDTTLYPGVVQRPTDPILLGNHWRESGDPHGNGNTAFYSGRSSSSNKVTDVPWSTSNSHHSSSNRNNGQMMMMMENPPTSSSATSPSPSTKYDWRMQSLMLCRHIMTRGLVDGIGSDIAVHVPAWGKIYHLHRLILDQNPYFSMLLQGGFREATSDSVTLHFENSPYITKESFYFVLQQLYGKLSDPNIHHDNVRQILATCSFFQLEHMCELCVDFILRTMNEANVILYLDFADNHMVHGSDRILNAVFTFLCREAYSMDMDRVADIPITWLKKVIESDAFWVPT